MRKNRFLIITLLYIVLAGGALLSKHTGDNTSHRPTALRSSGAVNSAGKQNIPTFFVHDYVVSGVGHLHMFEGGN
jgi:uncharacterized alpha/beta hydrolase family protein